MNNVTPFRRASEPQSFEALISAAKLLRTSISAFDLEHNDLNDYETSLADVREVVAIAMERIKGWLRDVSDNVDPQRAYVALDVLIVVDACMRENLLPKGPTICPLKGALTAAVNQLESLLDDEGSEVSEA